MAWSRDAAHHCACHWSCSSPCALQRVSLPCGRTFSTPLSLSFASSWPFLFLHLFSAYTRSGRHPASYPINVTDLFFAKCALRIEIADATAFAACSRIDHRVNESRLAGIHRRVYGTFQFIRARCIDAHTVERLNHFVVTRALHEHRRRRVRTGVVDVGAAINPVIVEDDDADRKFV